MADLSNHITYINLGAGIMILWMILSHAIGSHFYVECIEYSHILDIPTKAHCYINKNGTISPMPAIVYFPYLHFFMPWFFYKSGQFFKKRDYCTLIKKDIRKLLLPFFVWSIIGYLFYLILCYFDGDLSFRNIGYRVLKTFWLEGFVQLNRPLWFLYSFFMVRLIANILLPEKHILNKFIYVYMAILLGTLYGITYLSYLYKNPLIPQWVANISAGLAFYILGYFLHEHETKWCFFMPCLIIYLLCCILGFPIVVMKTNTLYQGDYLLNMPVCLASIVVFNVLCRLLIKLLPHIVIKPFEIIAKYAFIIYVSHGIIDIFITLCIIKLGLINLMPYTLWIILGAFALILPVLCLIYKKNFNIR